ncbi:MAG: molybdenum cofactor biosynthesis protein MoaE [Pseudomonadota bacterium]
MRILVTADPFDQGAELSQFTADGAGAVVSFMGVVRDDTGDLQALHIEHYPGMTEQALHDYAGQAKARFDLTNVLVIHRHGSLHVGEQIMMVATAARHRKAAFQGADFLMDYLKSRAPFWKKEMCHSGTHWVDAKDTDEDALAQWDHPG